MSVSSASWKTANSGGSSAQAFPQSLGFAIFDQREMPHRRHWAALGQAGAAVFCGPTARTHPWNSGPPAEPSRQRRERQFEDAARAAFGADVIDQNEFA